VTICEVLEEGHGGKEWRNRLVLAACGRYCELAVEDQVEIWRLADEKY